MKKKEVFVKVRFDIETKKTNAYFHADEDWSKHGEYQEMIKLGNYYEATFEEYLLCNNAQQCVIDGVLQPFVEADDSKLKMARAVKLSELKSFYSKASTWECTLKAVDGALTREKNWLRDNITLTSRFKDDKGVPFVKIFTAEQILKIKDDLQCFGSLIFDKKEEIESKINSAKKIADIEKIDIEKEFATVKKIITIS